MVDVLQTQNKSTTLLRCLRIIDWVVGFMILTVISSVSMAETNSNHPSSFALVETDKTQSIGRYVLQSLYRDASLQQDPWLHEQLVPILYQLNIYAHDQPPLALVIIKDNQINAFATPGGVIAINTGLIDKATSLDELVSVLAHEIAHVSQHHYQRRKAQYQQDQYLYWATMLASVLVARENGEAGSALAMGGQGLLIDRQLNYSRSQEREADRVGMQIMAQAGFNPNAMPDFFETLAAQNNQLGFRLAFLSTHPLTEERLSEARLRARAYPHNAYPNHHALFELIKWRTQGSAATISDVQFAAAAKDLPAAKLGYAKHLIEQGQADEALSWLRAYQQQQYPSIAKDVEDNATTMALADQFVADNGLYLITLSEYYVAKRDYQAATQVLSRLNQLMPERRDLRLYLAESLKHQGHHAQALKHIQPYIDLNQLESQPDIPALRLAADIIRAEQPSTQTGKQLQLIRLLRYQAAIEYWQGGFEEALVMLVRAKRLSSSYPSLLIAIDKQIDVVKRGRAIKP